MTHEEKEAIRERCSGGFEEVSRDRIWELRGCISELLAALDKAESRIEALEDSLEAQRNDLINERMNCELMTNHVEALERAVKTSAIACYSCCFTERSTEPPCRSCKDRSNWQFDEARFSKAGDIESKLKNAEIILSPKAMADIKELLGDDEDEIRGFICGVKDA